MAKNIKDPPANVVALNAPKKRGRPRGTGKVFAGQTAAAPPEERAPGFGHNQPDVGIFLRHVQAIRRQDGEIEKVKILLKTEKGKLKDIRKLAQADGLVMREVDEALEALGTEHVDLIAREQRRRLYFEWLNLPLGGQAELDLILAKPDPQREADRWLNRGVTDGRLGQERKAPEGIPPDQLQNYLRGYDKGYDDLLRASPVTGPGFAAAVQAQGSTTGIPATAAEAQHVAPPTPRVATTGPDNKILILREEAFAADTGLEDANLQTLMPAHQAAFDQAERVVAIFGHQRRILKEPLDDGSVYVDTGADDVDITISEDVESEQVDEIVDNDPLGIGESEADQEARGEQAPAAADLA